MMKARVRHLLVLLFLILDLGSPAIPGIFSVLHGDVFFMDGVTRAHGARADGKCVRDCSRVPTGAPEWRSAVPTMPTVPRAVVRDARAHQRRSPARPPHAVPARSPLDAEDH